MATTINLSSQKKSDTGVQSGIGEALLRSEIGFWRELIESCQETEPPDRIERMRYALALAESKLNKRTSNVYPLDKGRGV